MDTVLLSRLQFAVTVGFHFLFVPLTIGLALFIAIVETMYVTTNNPAYKTLARFWGKLFTINFLLGVVTGLTMEFQFGTNWSGYAKFMGDIFGSPLAFEALTAFFLESTFVSIWIFGWEKLSKGAHTFAAWMIVLGTHLSAVWIIVANGFMQRPVGYTLRDGRAVLTNFWDVFTNSYAWHTYVHTILSAYTVGGFFVLGITAYHYLRRQHVELLSKSMRLALVLALVGTLGVALSGDRNARYVAQVQPTKFAAMEGIWTGGTGVPLYIVQFPSVGKEQNSLEALPIPKLLSWLVGEDLNAEIHGLKEFPVDQRPSVPLTFSAFRLMVTLGVYMLVLLVVGLWFDYRGQLRQHPWYLRLLLWSIPVPYLAINLGWMVAEVGRQPWTVYGLMRTVDSVSPVAPANVLISLVGITLLYVVLVTLDIWFLARTAKLGPVATAPNALPVTTD